MSSKNLLPNIEDTFVETRATNRTTVANDGSLEKDEVIPISDTPSPIMAVEKMTNMKTKEDVR